MRIAEKLGRDLKEFALTIQRYDETVQEEEKIREKRVSDGMDPREAAKMMVEEMEAWDSHYSGTTPEDVLNALAEGMAGECVSLRDAYRIAPSIWPKLADLAALWDRSPQRVMAALRRLGPERWDSIELTDPEEVATLILDELLPM